MHRVAPTLALLLAITFLGRNAKADLIVSSFGSNGQGGTSNGQTFSFGSGGSVYEMDSFVVVGGLDLNGSQIGTAAQLSLNALPSGLLFSHSYQLSPDSSDITIKYTFVNQTGNGLLDFRFFALVDAEIDEPVNTYYNEFAQTGGSLGINASDPDSFEVDEPGYLFGDIFDNLRIGSLDNTNAIDGSFPDDVSMALGFHMGNIDIGSTLEFSVFVSEDNDHLGSFWITHFDDTSSDSFTFSGYSNISTVPEPSSLFLSASGVILVFILTRRSRTRHHIPNPDFVW